ncbi:GNAT family N-acetyltransferase [Microvirga massiliensis]|uniref:GNAT family N-acetyltransferase n=1 Tax=Microvirga massiliensis TaxID=1033741 RepID=UPI00062B8BFD|nr:GNAT family N-acetyltransferase [Microvirga massiliensis]
MLSWFQRPAQVPAILPLTLDHTERAALLHEQAFARPWNQLDFERLLSDRTVIADGLFLGPDPNPVGYVLSRVVIDEAEILTVTVAAEARGQGCARALLRHHFEGLARAGAQVVHLEVEEGNAPALALYRRLGFEETGRRPGYYLKPDGSMAHALTMRCSL